MSALRHLAALAAILALGTTVAACGGSDRLTGESSSGEVQQREIVFAYITPETFPYHDGAQRFKELLESSSQGKMTVKLYPGAQLGDEREIEEGILNGSITMGIGAGALAAYSPVMNLLELPFMIKDQDHMQRIIDSDVGTRLAERIKSEGGFEVVEWFSTGDSSIQTKSKRVSEPADLAGVKLRSIENPALLDALKAIGANPTPLPYPEVYAGLRTGVIGGATLDWTSVASLKLGGLVDYATSPEVAFLAEPRPVIVSAQFWESLAESERRLISEAITEAAAYERKTFRDKQKASIEALREAGMEMTPIDEAAFRERVEPVWDRWAKKLDAQDLLDDILAMRD